MKTKAKVAIIGAAAMVLAATIESKYNQNIDNENSSTIILSISNNNIIYTEAHDNMSSEIIGEPAYDLFVSKPYDINNLDAIASITVKVREYNGKDTNWKDKVKIEKGKQIEFRIVFKI